MCHSLHTRGAADHGMDRWILLLTITMAMCSSSYQIGVYEIISDTFKAIVASDIMKMFNRRTFEDERYVTEYDFIVVGAGSAGAIIANRLSEIASWKVLLLEAGDEDSILVDIPILVNLLQLTHYNWKYKTESSDKYCLAMEQNQCKWPRGKVLGGSSALNYMIFTRNNRRDYEQMVAMGMKDWSWDHVLPYFKKVEQALLPEYDLTHRGHDGYIPVSEIPYKTPIARMFLQAGQELGYSIVDFNGSGKGGNQTGFNYIQATLKNGERWSSSRSYLGTIRSQRKNLYIRKKSQVTKILINEDTKTAYGVEYIHNDAKYTAYASKEVIVSAGAINSPQLLMLSGIGPRNHLNSLGIPFIKHLKVGYHLQDHLTVGGLTYMIDQPFSIQTETIADFWNILQFFTFHDGPWTIPGGCEALAFLDLHDLNTNDGHPEVEILLTAGGIVSDDSIPEVFGLRPEFYQDVYANISHRHTVTLIPLVLRPKSEGRIKLSSANPLDKPLIIPNYYSDPERYDIQTAIAAIRKSNDIMLKTNAFQRLHAALHRADIPACRIHRFDTDAYWECYSRHMSLTLYHFAGTCKMGAESSSLDAVVDPQFRVYGIKQLRVIDASVFPFMPASHINAVTYMFAERGADFIKQYWLHGKN